MKFLGIAIPLIVLLGIMLNNTVWFFVCGMLYIPYALWVFQSGAKERKSIESPWGFAKSSIARNPSRSLLCIAIIASTTFLVLSISAFRLDSPDAVGFIAETAFPVYADITTPHGRELLGIQPDDEQYLAESVGTSTWHAFRMKDGDSSSCLNLYKTGNPRILGVPQSVHCANVHRARGVSQEQHVLLAYAAGSVRVVSMNTSRHTENSRITRLVEIQATAAVAVFHSERIPS